MVGIFGEKLVNMYFFLHNLIMLNPNKLFSKRGYDS